MITRLIFAALLCTPFMVSSLPPEWPQEFGDRDAIHRQLGEINKKLNDRFRAKISIKRYTGKYQEDRSEENLNGILGAVGDLIELDDKKKQVLYKELKKNWFFTKELLLNGIDHDCRVYQELIHSCRGAQEENTSLSVYGFLDLLFLSKEYYLTEQGDVAKRSVGAVPRICHALPNYIETDRKFYQEIYSSLWDFVEQAAPKNIQDLMRTKAKKLPKYAALIAGDFVKRHKELTPEFEAIAKADREAVFEPETRHRLLQLEAPKFDKTLKLLKILYQSSEKERTPRQVVFSTYMGDVIVLRMLRPFYDQIRSHQENQARAERAAAREEAAAEVEGGTAASSSAHPDDKGFSLLAFAEQEGFYQGSDVVFGPKKGDGPAAEGVEEELSTSDSSDDEEW